MNPNGVQDQLPPPTTGQQRDHSEPAAVQFCPPFVPQVLRQQMMLDSTLWWLFRGTLIAMACLAAFEAVYLQATPESGLSPAACVRARY